MIRAAEPAVFEFGGFRLEPQRRLLSRDGEPVIVTDKAFDALVYLIEHAGQLVTKDDLIKALWPDIVVEENNLYVVISTLRKALKDESGAQRLIATIAGRGYQFVAQVQVGASSVEAAPVPPATSAVVLTFAESVGSPGSSAVVLAIAGIVAVIALRPARAPAAW